MPELTCIRLLDAEAPAGPLAEAVRAMNAGQGGAAVHVVDATSFSQVPNAPFAYWVEEKVRRLFKELPAFESEGRTARQGLATADDFRFVRCWWEVPVQVFDSPERRWWPFAKGGAYSPYYADLHLVVNWKKKGAEIKENIIQKYPYLNGKSEFVAKNTDFYFRPGLTWPRRTNGLSFRVLPRGCVFADKGPAAFDENDVMPLCALLNSECFGHLVSVQLARVELAQSFEVGIIQNTPLPPISGKTSSNLSSTVTSIWKQKRMNDSCNEPSHAFVAPWFGPKLHSLADLEKELAASRNELLGFVHRQQAVIDNAAEAIYGFKAPGASPGQPNLGEGDDEDEDAAADMGVARKLLSYLLGVAFGRWAIPANPEELRKHPEDPFAPLPPQSPGAAPVTAAKLYFVEDDSGESPLLNACCEALRQATGLADISSYEQDLAARLEVPSLRDYLVRPAGFFADHLSVYSKSRRKAPIYWPLSTRSGDFVIWVYYPKLDADSLPRLITEVLDPRLRRLNEELAALAADGKASARKAKLEALRLELAEMRQDFQELIAKGYKPDLNDGVLITACPLAKYFRLPKFRRDLEDCWKKLSRGDYDWAHLAMSMWPERATEACRRDRSIAIAHGKEDLCPAEPPKAKRGRKKAD